MNHSQVAVNFGSRKVNSRYKTVTWRGSNVFCEGDTIYSYGYHFPMAIYLGEKSGRHFFIKNGDRYSSSTSGHQSNVQAACNGPTVSRLAVIAAGIPFHELTLDNIVCFRKDSREHIYRDNEGRYWKRAENIRTAHDEDHVVEENEETPVRSIDAQVSTDGVQFSERFMPPRQGQFMIIAKHKTYTVGCWHVLGAVVLHYKKHYYLCSLDEQQYFISKLPGKPRSVQHAFHLLKPKQVLSAERKGLEVLRQGEWFFVPSEYSDKELAEKAGYKSVTALYDQVKAHPLPSRPVTNDRQQSGTFNEHVCRWIEIDGEMYAIGKVYHKNKITKSVTGEHRTLDLEGKWFKVYLNTELASWTTGGRVD